MGRSKRRSTLKKKDKEDKDLEYHNEPDEESEDFYHDDVDKYFKDREKILLNTEGEDDDSANEDDDDFEEVIGLSDDDDDDSNDEDDDDDDMVDEDESEDDFRKALPSEDAWGKRMSTFYHVDKIGENIESDEEAEQLAEEEEEEAILIQKRLAATLDEQDFDTENFQLKTEVHAGGDDIEGDEEILKEKALVQKDLSKLSKNEKLEILVKDSPELLELLEEFRAKMQIILTTLQPLVNMARTEKISEQGLQYLEVRHQLYLNYCINIGFYLLLKARQVPVRDHPVIGKLVQYRMLIKDLEPLDERFEPEIQKLLKHGSTDETENLHMEKENFHSSTSSGKPKLSALLDHEDGQESHKPNNSRLQPRKKKVKRKIEPVETTDDVVDPLAYYEQVKLAKKKKKEEKEKKFRLVHQEPDFVVETEAPGVDGKRGITYQISKNKGLTPKRKKELRNPRVKHRKKFQKAVIKRKSQVRAVVTELQRYGGETTGVRSNLVRSVKIK